jgi:hypothetical protein
MSVCLFLVSEISFVYLQLIFLFCLISHDQQLVHHIHNGLILINSYTYLISQSFMDSFLSLQPNVLASCALHTYVALVRTHVLLD